jgi:hypothetical protein
MFAGRNIKWDFINIGAKYINLSYFRTYKNVKNEFAKLKCLQQTSCLRAVLLDNPGLCMCFFFIYIYSFCIMHPVRNNFISIS